MAHPRELILLLMAIHCATTTRVSLTNNGYSDLVVAISPDVPKTDAVDIINNIKDVITKASPVLYSATRSRSYFKSVRILIPQQWDNVQASTSTWENFEDADVQVDLPSGRYGDKPYTIQPGGCGEPGNTIRLTPGFLGNGAQFGQPEKLFVVEWARLRYGVFEEMGSAADPQYPLFYSTPSEEILPNGCFHGDDLEYHTEDVNGGACKIDPSTGIYDKNCTVVWSPDFQPSSSLMTYPKVESVVHFCDDATHNKEAPTKHNVQCNSQSVWTVITQHADFANNNNPPNNIASLTPSFTIVRAEAARFVLLADISGSMDTFSRIVRLNNAGRRWIKYDVSDGSRVGIVTFGTTAAVKSQLTVINNATRPTLAAQVPSVTDGWTCIGCGLQTSMDVLGSNTVKGGVILLISDGEENRAPYVKDVMAELVASEARVVSMAFGRSASNLIEDLADQTGGKSYFINDDPSMSGLVEAFTDSRSYQPAVPSDQFFVKLFEKKYRNSGTSLSGTFAVDSTANRNMKFRLEYNNRNHIISVQLTSPSNVYSNVIYDSTANLGLIEIPLAEVGTWSFQVTVGSSTTDYVTVSVASQARSNTAPIRSDCFVTTGPTVLDPVAVPVRIVARVTQGGNPVIGAKVKAYIEKPDDTIKVLDLKDDGKFADVTAGDGMYSRFFVSINNLGRYSVICQVWNDGSAYIDNGFIANSATINSRSRPIGRSNIGSFTRSAVGGAFNAKAVVSSTDPYPPGRVVNLQIAGYDVYDGTVTLRWTAPGDDLDDGTVHHYQIKYSESFNDINDNNFNGSNSIELTESNVVSGSLQPLPAGSVQTVTFHLPSSRITTYFFALRAVDDANKTSTTSNVASVKMAYPEPVPELPPITCSGDDSIPQEGECSQYYYICDGGQAYTGSCRPSYVFEPFNRTCVPAASALDCRITRCQADGDFPLNGLCNSHYVICLGGIGYSAMCPTDQVFDPATWFCVPDLQSSCKSTQPSSTTTPGNFVCPDHDGNFPHNSDCHLFYSCSDGIAYIRECYSGLVYNPAIDQCDYPANVPGCQNAPSG